MKCETKHHLKKLLCILMLVVLVTLVSFPIAYANDKVVLYFFWGDGCPHCLHEKSFLEELQKKYPQLEIKSYEVWHNEENANFFSDMAEAFGTKVMGVPTTFVNDKIWIGFADYMSKEIENKVKYCIEYECIDPIEKLKMPSETKEISQSNETLSPINKPEENIITLPLFGRIDTSKISLPIFTIIIAGMDGFNPCAFFVLFFLLSMLVYAQSRKRMLLIGSIFVFFSGFVYFLFMAAWLNFFLLVGQLMIITIIAGIIALLIATINIKDFFFFGKGVSLVIPKKAKPKLFTQMRNLLKATSIPSMIVGTIILAIAANTYELLCTAGFPMVFTRVLTLHNLSMIEYYLYLIFYNIIYVIPLTIIVLMFVITLGTRKLTEQQGRMLKLVSGMMMLYLGLVLLINPTLLNNIFISAGILTAAITSSGLVILATKRIRKIREVENEQG